MIQKLLFVSWALAGSVLAKSVSVCNQPTTEWLGPNITAFVEPSTDNYASYIFIDTPSQLSLDNSTCVCSPIVNMFSYWMTNGTWTTDKVTKKCDLTCDRCQVYFCADNFEVDLNNSTNVTVAADGTPTCVLSTPLPPSVNQTTTTSTVTLTPVSTSNNITLEVDVHVVSGNTTLNVTFDYPSATTVPASS